MQAQQLGLADHSAGSGVGDWELGLADRVVWAQELGLGSRGSRAAAWAQESGLGSRGSLAAAQAQESGLALWCGLSTCGVGLAAPQYLESSWTRD